MTTVYDVPPNHLIDAVAEELKTSGKIELPEWAAYVKTGVNKEMPPVNPDWWYVRCASVLRRIYIDGPVGVSRLRSYYGGKHRRKTVTGSFAKGSGSVVREALQQLERAGYVKKMKAGRQLTPAGQSFMDNLSHQVKLEVQKSIPELERY
ncbi:MAG: 30S ribosomal protein S19e [Methanothrix sp.]|nr:30S ribosomal protein S19e [Methanothrix sp.]NLX38781.1 30S ribosomal protein S19e [Methanothrix sp.]OPX81899.1 MAG: 30S ribosomal protein S19e [Methanosaeta sp. PtaB.Bin087]OPY57098.1 MAG: 30S ribosomal protein S19e [Methanosaeta sp. PtaU1.Bin055]HOI69654.1 30S ribosomal protein S19e [Methanothrix sp.]